MWISYFIYDLLFFLNKNDYDTRYLDEFEEKESFYPINKRKFQKKDMFIIYLIEKMIIGEIICLVLFEVFDSIKENNDFK